MSGTLKSFEKRRVHLRLSQTSVILSGKNPEHTKMVTGIDYKTVLALWDNLIKTNFAGKTEDELNKIKNAIMRMAMVKYTISSAVNKQTDKKSC